MKGLGPRGDWGRRGTGRAPPPHWLAAGSDLSPEPASPLTVLAPRPRRPGPASLTALLRRHPRGCSGTRRRRRGGGNFTVRTGDSGRRGAGSGHREGAQGGGGQADPAGRGRAVAGRWESPGRPAAATPLPRRPRCAPGSAPRAAPPSPSLRARAPSPPGLQPPVSPSQLAGDSGAAGLDGAQGSGRAARRSRRRTPASGRPGEQPPPATPPPSRRS